MPLNRDYAEFARSFSQIRAPDIKASVDHLYEKGRFWPEPLISINPRCERGETVYALAKGNTLHHETARVFRAGGHPPAAS